MKKFFSAIILTLTILNITIKVSAEPSVKDMSLTNNLGTNSNFPSTFDLREIGKVSNVKNQGESNACWSFAAIDSLQSSLLPNSSYDFSENNMKNTNAFDYQSDDGGEKSMAVAYLTSWQGPVNEQDDPFNENSITSPSNLEVQKHVQDVYFIPSMTSGIDTEQIKKALMDYGAVFTNIKWDPSYYNNMYKSYYYNSYGRVNHSITIVGWDDNFDKNNFNFTPRSNGAFIIKDSKGASFGENGYYYISYFDALVGTENACFTAESTDNYNNIYQYDYMGYVNKFGYDTENAYFSNVFDALKDENLAAVSFYTLYPDCQFEIKVYNSVQENPNDGILVSEKTGIMELPGYHTIELNKYIPLNKGDKFSVVVGFKNVNSAEPIAIECPENGYSSKAEANHNESFVSPDGTNWEDITLKIPETNVCLKAFTVNKTTTKNPTMVKENIVWNLDKKYVVIPYNTNIAFNPSTSEIKERILISTNNTEKYLPLEEEDIVKIGSDADSNKLIIHFANSLDMPSVKLKVLENTLINQDTGDLQDTAEETQEYKQEKLPSMISESASIDEGRSVITIPYNTYIEWYVETSKINQNILISIDDNPFKELGDTDDVNFNVLSNKIIITLGEALQGEKVKIKVLKNTIKNMLGETEISYIQSENQETLSIKLNRKQPVIDRTSVTVDASKKVICIPYNCRIQPADKYTNLLSRVLISQNEKNFSSLSKNDKVEIGSGKYANCLIITLDSMLVGDSFSVKVLSDSLKNITTSDKQTEEECTDIMQLQENYYEFRPQLESPSANYMVSPEKEFKISFNKPVNIDTLYGNIVIVKNDTMKKEKIIYSILAENQNTIVIKHEKPFEKNVTYTLYISNYIRTSKGNDTLKSGTKLSFIVNN